MAGQQRVNGTDLRGIRPIFRALSQKLPKLVEADADLRVLVLEKYYLTPGTSRIGRAVHHLQRLVPEMARVDEVWVADTAGWHWDEKVHLFPVWPARGMTKIAGHLQEFEPWWETPYVAM